MSAIYDHPAPAGPGQAPPEYPWPGYGGPAGPGGPAGYGGGPGGSGSPVRRYRRLLVAAAAVILGLTTFLGLHAAGAVGDTALTTSQIAARVNPGLVNIVSTLGYRQAQAAGTGMVLTPSGEVLTNNHVIEGATSIVATDVGNGRRYRASVVGYDQTHDIAVLRLQGASHLATVTLGNSAAARPGQRVVALGNAGGKGGTPSVATGRITGLNASITASDQGAGTSEKLRGLIHHNAPIQPGDSGGPLVNTAGQVIGINTAASARYRLQPSLSQPGGTQATRTQAFAVPVSQASRIAGQIEAGKASATVHIGATGFLGVQILSADVAAADGVQPGSGAVVAGVLPGTPAGRAGLASGDVITAVGGRTVSSPSALQAALVGHHPGDHVTVTWTDPAGQPHSGTVILATGPAA